MNPLKSHLHVHAVHYRSIHISFSNTALRISTLHETIQCVKRLSQIKFGKDVDGRIFTTSRRSAWNTAAGAYTCMTTCSALLNSIVEVSFIESVYLQVELINIRKIHVSNLQK